MPLNPVEPPEEVSLAAATHVHMLAGTPESFLALADVERENLELVAPHKIYTLSLEAAAGGARLADAQPGGWRFLVADGERVVASAEVPEEEGRHAPSVNSGAYVQATADAIDRLEEMPEVASGAFEMRLLKVPALYVAAAWLADEGNLVVPLEPAPSYLEPGHAYREEEFLDALREPAQRVVAMDDGESGG